MSWISTLNDTYHNMIESVLFPDLLPIAHTTQQAHIEVTINELSEFVGGSVVLKSEAETVIPCTEQSAGRAGSHPVNHPLMDKLQYVAGDYTKFGGNKGESFYQKYMEDLSRWCESEYSNLKVKALFNYLMKGTLIEDLIQDKVLYCDDNQKLYKKYPDKKTEPPIFKVIQGEQSDAFVRFIVTGFEDIDNYKTALWEDKNLQQDYINYYLDSRKDKGLCYVLGKETSLSINHPSKIRHSGDMAKLISSNDTSGFTFRGRFINSSEAAGISYEASQAAHSALKELIKRQGKNFGGRVYIAWNPNCYEVPNICEDSYDIFAGTLEKIPNTAEDFANELFQVMAGYQGSLSYHDRIVIMGIDAATTGRMAITFYREERANELLKNLEAWHKTCAWKHRYKFKEKEPVDFYGAPAPVDIALAAFGIERSNKLELDDKLKKNTVERILHCIIDGEKIPFDIVEGAYRSACYPQKYNYFTWRKILSITCALLKKYYYDKSEEEWSVELNEKEENLEYLCGRLLAVADVIERSTFNSDDDKYRTTNAMRYFTKFMEHPCQTWKIINNALVPYISKLGYSTKFYQKLLGDISAKLDSNEFYNARNLDGRMALGFYAQINDLYIKKEEKVESKEKTENELK